MSEMDRNFNSKTGKYVYDVKYYYYEQFPLLLLGFFNTTNRILNPSHTHYFNSSNFESDKILKNNYKLIQKEALELYNKKDKLMNMKDLSELSFSSIDTETNAWKVYVLKWYDKINCKAYYNCPETCKLLEQCNDIYVAMFSILEPGKYIKPHKGPSTFCLRYHLGLSIPKDKENCYIIVNDEKFIWTEGESLIFDDTYVHSVYNNTSEPRIILFIDIVRPTNFLMSKINNYLLSSSSLYNFTKKINDSIEKKQLIVKETFI